jgi:predicted small lipoprotein YifL
VILIVKSPFALPAAGFVLATLLSACGQTGPLYMPKPPARTAAGTPAAGTPAAGTPAAGTPAAGSPANQATPANTVSPPAPAAGMMTPPAGSNSNNTQAPQSPPATQQ